MDRKELAEKKRVVRKLFRELYPRTSEAYRVVCRMLVPDAYREMCRLIGKC